MARPERSHNVFSVMARRDGPRLSVWLSGDVDIATEDLVDSTLDAMAVGSTELPDEIYFHLGSVGFVDSTGVTVLVAARQMVAPVEGRVVIVAPPPMLLQLLEITNLADQFVIEAAR